MNIIFLDIDGVLNCEVYYAKQEKDPDGHSSQICSTRLGWLNQLCKDVNAKVVVSSSWKENGVEELKKRGATFEILGVTPSCNADFVFRGNEIYKWILDNQKDVLEVPYYEFNSYVIIDDDSDMLLWQQNHFFQTDGYSGLTPNVCHRIRQFFNKIK